MSDSKSSYGDPVDEPTDADRDADVVGRAREALAEAEAARAEVPADAATPVSAERPAADEPETVVIEETVVVEDRTEDPDDARWAMYAASAEADARAEEARADQARADARAEEARADQARADDTRVQDARRDETPTVAATPVVTPSEPVPERAAAYGGAQPIFVQAPEAPRPRGNRGAAGAIGLLATLVFAVLYLAATLGLGLLNREFELSGVVEATTEAVTTWAFWVPVVVFFLAFWLLGAVINRGRWGHWVVWGILVGLAAYAGHLLGALFQEPFWMLTAREGAELLEGAVLAPLAIVAFVLGRELTIWFGAWVAARGRRMTELNEEAQREYERTLEAGPQLHRA